MKNFYSTTPLYQSMLAARTKITPESNIGDTTAPNLIKFKIQEYRLYKKLPKKLVKLYIEVGRKSSVI